jgi:hypothetical protein
VSKALLETAVAMLIDRGFVQRQEKTIAIANEPVMKAERELLESACATLR